jgi:hypothetical protein
MLRAKVLFIALVGTALFAACNSGGTEAGVCVSPGILFLDDFSGSQMCGWAEYSQSGAAAAVEEGVLRLTTSQPGPFWWTNPGRNFDNVIITVQARQASGPDNNAFGVICRYQSPENFYVFLISGDGYYAIGKYQSGTDQITYLTGDGQYHYIFSDAINQGVATNQMRVSCVNNELSLTVNGIPLPAVTDPTFVTGDIGLGVSAFEVGTAVIEFDNIQVIAP